MLEPIDGEISALIGVLGGEGLIDIDAESGATGNTVETHRSNITWKMEFGSLADLVAIRDNMVDA